MVSAFFTLAVSVVAWGIEDDPDLAAFNDLSLEELLNVDVTSVSKHAESKTRAAAAVNVITSEDIRHSPARTIPDLLRTVPGLHVAQLDGNKWSITARGFGGRFSNKLLVLIDGRSVYTGVFSGVYWETQMTPLMDVERIEIVRGPGGTLWGANAVNGVINIVTKSTEATQGGLLEVGGGTEAQGFGTLRYGGRLSDDAFYRVFAAHERWGDQGDSSLGDANDRWERTYGGFRIDWKATERDSWTFLANTYEAPIHEAIVQSTTTPPYSRNIDSEGRFTGYNATAHWTRNYSEDKSLQVRLSVDEYTAYFDALSEQVRSLDLELFHKSSLNERHSLAWGAGFRYTDMDFDTSPFVDFNDESPRKRLFSAFVQDTIALDHELTLILGGKLEYNDYTGVELQPNARVSWTPSERTTVWGAISRAVRTPSQVEDDVRLLIIRGPAFRAELDGDKDYDSESVISYELGVRRIFADGFAVDAALFYNDYDKLRTVELAAPYSRFFGLNPEIVLPFRGANNGEGKTFGIELTADWQVRDWWRLKGVYSYLYVRMDLHPKTISILSDSAEGDTPHHQASLQSQMNLPHGVELDTTLRYVGDLPALDVDDYLALDVRLGWRPRDNFAFSVVGTDLLDSQRIEYKATFVDTVPTERQRGVYAKFSWSF